MPYFCFSHQTSSWTLLSNPMSAESQSALQFSRIGEYFCFPISFWMLSLKKLLTWISSMLNFKSHSPTVWLIFSELFQTQIPGCLTHSTYPLMPVILDPILREEPSSLSIHHELIFATFINGLQQRVSPVFPPHSAAAATATSSTFTGFYPSTLVRFL